MIVASYQTQNVCRGKEFQCRVTSVVFNRKRTSPLTGKDAKKVRQYLQKTSWRTVAEGNNIFFGNSTLIRPKLGHHGAYPGVGPAKLLAAHPQKNYYSLRYSGWSESYLKPRDVAWYPLLDRACLPRNPLPLGSTSPKPLCEGRTTSQNRPRLVFDAVQVISKLCTCLHNYILVALAPASIPFMRSLTSAV